MQYKYFIGIDPGQNGAMAVVNLQGELIKVISFSENLRKLWGFNIINPQSIKTELMSLPGFKDFKEIACLTERVSSYDQGRNSSFNFGANSIGLVLVLEILGVGVINSTSPIEWKDLMGVSSKNLSTIPKSDRELKKILKGLSKKKAQKLFPNFQFKNTATADEEEASLLAWLCWNSHCKGKK